MAIDESANLAKERGSYKHFQGSRWSQGMVPLDSITALEADRGIPTHLKRDSKNKQLNWDALRAKVKQGMRNATLMAVAPNANIGLVAGTTPGIDPRFAQVFSRNKISGKYMDINHNLVKDLKNMGIWDEVKDQIVEQQGDLSAIPQIPQYLKQIYKTSFTTSPYAFIEIAARAQKWVDQALSRNMYLENRDMDEMKNVYMAAWKKGLKTTYYLHMKPRHTAEQSTTTINKAAAMGKKGFSSVVASAALKDVITPGEVSPIQPSTMPVPELVTVSSSPSAVVQQAEMPSRGFAAVANGQTALPLAGDVVQSVTAVVQAPLAPVSSSPAPSAGFAMAVKKPETSGKAFVCPVDPAERAQCDSCQ
jgi:ribonucleoside-diphosphate reductase alpha chain